MGMSSVRWRRRLPRPAPMMMAFTALSYHKARRAASPPLAPRSLPREGEELCVSPQLAAQVSNSLPQPFIVSWRQAVHVASSAIFMQTFMPHAFMQAPMQVQAARASYALAASVPSQSFLGSPVIGSIASAQVYFMSHMVPPLELLVLVLVEVVVLVLLEVVLVLVEVLLAELLELLPPLPPTLLPPLPVMMQAVKLTVAKLAAVIAPSTTAKERIFIR